MTTGVVGVLSLRARGRRGRRMNFLGNLGFHCVVGFSIQCVSNRARDFIYYLGGYILFIFNRKMARMRLLISYTLRRVRRFMLSENLKQRGKYTLITLIKYY